LKRTQALVFNAGRAECADGQLARGKKLKELNPFQASAVLIGNPQFHRRERFKKIFFAVLAVHVLLFLTLLIQGCRSGRQATASESSASTMASVQH
jgi:hypothetical protein